MAGSVLSPVGGQGSDEERATAERLALELIRQMRAGHAAGVRKTRVIGFPALPAQLRHNLIGSIPRRLRP